MDDKNEPSTCDDFSSRDDMDWHQAISEWQRDDQCWQQDITDWLQHTQRLVALLYLLEKALPEHSSQLEQHRARLDKHNALLSRFRQEVEETYPKKSASERDLRQHTKMHEKLAKNHFDMQREHDELSNDYRSKMQQFTSLAERLHQELESH
jgi:patatin-like phospholipase/acyl hydrolase